MNRNLAKNSIGNDFHALLYFYIGQLYNYIRHRILGIGEKYGK